LPGIDEETDSQEGIRKILNGEYDVIGGTAWVWSKEELFESIDDLVVDEAGQMSLANVLACAQAAKNIVLLGDPQQLEQPQKAAHPEGSDLSALEYLLEEHDTMPEERGLFLGETWRLHPSICRFTSEMFYEGKLHPHTGLKRQVISGPTPYAGAGLFYIPIVHEGNQNESIEEAERVQQVVKSLVGPDVTWTDCDGNTKLMTLNDILIVAPYNAQVSEIAARIPRARIGTVDKFQGQEAPVVIYSMATSTPEDAPHGMDFLFSRHRLNVATSRAKCVCILVGNPKLFEPECRTPEQMRMANAFCRYLELAREVG
jgi:superfamily I DNA and/or RNA helicase